MAKSEYRNSYYASHKEQWKAYYESRRKRAPLYATWKSILTRTGHGGKPKDHDIKRYIDRGIDICEQWLDFNTFQKWCLDNGWKRGLTIDRIDNDSGYRPDNCRFVTPLENQLNRSCTHFIEINGSRMTLFEYWRDHHCDGVSYKCAENRYRRLKWDPVLAVSLPKKR